MSLFPTFLVKSELGQCFPVFSFPDKLLERKQHIHRFVSARTHTGKNFLPGESVFMYLPSRHRRCKLQSMTSSHQTWPGVATL